MNVRDQSEINIREAISFTIYKLCFEGGHEANKVLKIACSELNGTIVEAFGPEVAAKILRAYADLIDAAAVEAAGKSLPNVVPLRRL